MPGRPLRAWICALGLVGLSGCASLVESDAGALSGRISVSIAAHAGEAARGTSAQFELRGNSRAGTLRLMNPLGLQMAEARWQPGEVVLLTAQGESRFDTLEAMAREVMGEPIPLQALPDWLLGQPWPDAAMVPTTVGFEQFGWSVDSSRQSEGLIVATRHSPPSVTVRARVDRPT